MFTQFRMTITTAVVALVGVAVLTATQNQEGDGDNALNPRQRSIATIAAFTAKGDVEQLATAFNNGLDVGLTVNEIKEVLVQMYAYAGFPRSLNGIGAFMQVLDERKAKGIVDQLGAEASLLPADTSRIALGTATQTRLSGGPVMGAMFTFAPAIDEFLKTHLFADIFGRDNLDDQSREIATIAALASMPGLNAQLQSHFSIGTNTGLTESQLRGLVAVIRTNVGRAEATNADDVLNQFLSSQTK